MYPGDETVKETIDLYLESLNKHITKEKPKTATHRKSKKQLTKDMVFIKRFIDLNKKIISKQQLGAYIQALQHAISRKEIRRPSPLAYHIEQIQNKLIKIAYGLIREKLIEKI